MLRRSVAAKEVGDDGRETTLPIVACGARDFGESGMNLNAILRFVRMSLVPVVCFAAIALSASPAMGLRHNSLAANQAGDPDDGDKDAPTPKGSKGGQAEKGDPPKGNPKAGAGSRGGSREPAAMLDPELRRRLEALGQNREADAGQESKGKRPARTPRSRRNRPVSSQKQDRPSVRAGSKPGAKGPAGEKSNSATTTIDIPPALTDIMPEEKSYSFSIKDGTYEQLVEAFARQTGLGVIGEAPKDGKVNFVTREQMTFHAALARVRMLLFKYKPHEPYWLFRRGTHLEVIRVNDIYRILPINRMYSSLELYRAANLPDDELALVIYKPESGSVADLRVVRDFMPDYVRVVPLEGRNSVTIFALVQDINKYLDLIQIFVGGNDDPRTIERIEIQYISPSDAINKLQSLMVLDGSVRPRGSTSRRGGKESSRLDNMRAPEVSLLPDDTQGVLIVRAMQDKIEEIKLLLPYVDVDTSSDQEPVVIALKHAKPGELIDTIQQILSATSLSLKSVPPKKAPSRRKQGATPAAVSAQVGRLTMLTHPSKSAIIVLGDEEGVKRVRELVAQFDLPSELGPLLIDLEHADAAALISTVLSVLGEAGRTKGTSDSFKLVPDRTGDAIWFRGHERDLKRVSELVKMLDVPAQEVTLRVVPLVNQPPSFVSSMLRAYDKDFTAANPTAAPSKKGSARRSSKPTNVAKFTADDELGVLYILCTDLEWERYHKIIDTLENAVDQEDPFVRLAVEHITPDEAIDGLSNLFSATSRDASVRYMTTEGGVLVMDATQGQLEDIKILLAEIDHSFEIVQRTFEIREAEPTDIKSLIELLIGEGRQGSKPGTRRSRKGAKAPTAMAPTSTVLEDVMIIELGNRLVVRTTPQKMEQVAALIAEFDVAQVGTELKIYDDFPPGTDIDGIAETLASLMSGVKTTGRAPKPSAVRTPTGNVPRFIPQPAARRLLVIADPTRFGEIERLLDVLRHSIEVEPIITEFIELQFADPAELIEQIVPLLDMKIGELENAGRLTSTGEASGPSVRTAKKRKTGSGTGGSRYHMVADGRNRRIVIAAGQIVIDEAKTLIAQFDRLSDAEEVVFRTVELSNADPAEMVKAIRDMMGAPVRPSARKGATKIPASAGSGEGVALTLVEAPGGRAIILHGALEDVEQAAGWIEQLDARSSRGRTIKAYQIMHADIVKLVDLIMNVVDTPSVKKRPGAKPSRGRKSVEPEEESEFALSRTWTGQEVYIQADLIASTMLVAASAGKIAQIDDIITQFDTEEAEISSVQIPKFIYELQYADSYDAAFDLEIVLDQLWDYPGEPPSVESAFFGNYLIVRYPHDDKFDEIRQLIREHVDNPDDNVKIVRRIKRPPEGYTAKEAALWLKMNYPELDIEVVDLSSGEINTYGIEQVTPAKTLRTNPCVLPLTLTRMADDLVLLVAQQEQADPPDDLIKEAVSALMGGDADQDADSASDPESTEHKDSRKLPGASKVRITYSEEEGVFVIEGPAGVLEDVDDWMEEMKEEIKEGSVKADIRIYRVRYIDVNSAAAIIEEMFNATRQQRQMAVAQQRQAAQRQRQQQQQQQRQQQRQRQGKNDQSGQQNLGRSGQRGQQQQQQANVSQLPPTTVRVYPNPRDRTLILRADTSQYPALLELLATIDQPKPIDNELRIFHLEKLNAAEVEDLLKDMLELDATPKRGTRRTSTRAAGGRQGGGISSAGSPGGQLPETLMQATVTGTGVLGIDPEDIKLSSNEMANTIVVMAPKSALDYIGELIERLESEEIRERTARYYELEFAEATEVAEYLATHFDTGSARKTTKSSRKSGGKRSARSSTGSALTAPSFLPYSRLNLLTVQALEEDFEEIEEIITRIDVRDEQEWEHYTLDHADAAAVAGTLTEMFGGKAVSGKRGKRSGTPSSSGSGPKFIGEEGGRMLIFSAPAAKRELIVDTIAKLESAAATKTTVRLIELKHAKPSEVADAIQAAYGGGRSGRSGRGKSRGSSTSQFTVTGDDASKLLFVVADDATFAEIEALTRSLDKPRDFDVEFRIYPLVYASAKQVHAQMTKLMADYLRRLGRGASGLDAFSIEADEKSNSLIVLGSPAVFGFIEENLAKIDTPANAASPPAVLTMALKDVDAAEIAQTINQLYGGRNMAPGEEKPQATANRSANVLIVRGTQKQIDEISKEILEPLKEHAILAKQIHTYKLEQANAQDIAQALQGLYRGRKSAVRGEQPVQITPDPATNSLLILASEDEMAELTVLLETLDIEPVLHGTQLVKAIHLENADPFVAQDAITKLFRSSGRSPRDQVAAIADHQTNSVIVSASSANMKRIEEFLTGFDSEAGTQLQIHVINIENAEATAVARTLNDVFVRSAPRSRGGGAPPISISSVQGSRAILIKCNEEDFADIQEAVSALDSEEAMGAEEIRVVTLQYGDAAEMQRAMQDTLKKQGGRGNELVGDVRISALPGSNALVVSGSAEQVAGLEAKIQELDEAAKIGATAKLIRLVHVSVGQILPTLRETFTEVRGRPRGQVAPIITADETQNTLIVRAGPADLTAIESLVSELDNEEGASGRGFRIVQLAMGVNLDDIADLVQQSINEGARGRAGQGRGRQVANLTVTADKRTHALVFSGSSELFDPAEQLARAMEGMGPSGKKPTLILRPRIPMDEFERLISHLKGESASTQKRSTRRPTKSRSRSGNRGRSAPSRGKRPRRP